MDLVGRGVQDVATQYLAALRVVILNGPRQSGKTTLMRQLLKQGGQWRNLDEETDLTAAIRDPVGFVSHKAGPLFIDEVQRGGEPLVRAIKAAVDRDPRPGQFALAGSIRFLRTPSLSESLAGRAGVVEVLPFSQSELAGQQETFVDRAFCDSQSLRAGSDPMPRDDIISLLCRGGFPEPIRLADGRLRRAWFANYLAAVTDTDLREMTRINQPSAAATVLRALAAMSAQSLVTSTLAQKADLTRSTVDRYRDLLDAVFLVHQVPPWSRNPLTQAVRHPKTYLVDTGLLCHLLGLGEHALRRSDAAALGPVVETFVVNELQKQLTWSTTDASLRHYRDAKNDREVDVILEADDGRLVAIEVKAAQSVRDRDTRHLDHLRDRLGVDFVHGFVIYLGSQALSLGDRLTALPLPALWEG